MMLQPADEFRITAPRVSPSPRLRCKLWLEVEGEAVFGSGRSRLLEAVDEFGSLSEAASRQGMSYRSAWGKIKATEERLGFRLLDRRVGGRGGGGATLTREARELLAEYQAFQLAAERAVRAEFKRRF